MTVRTRSTSLRFSTSLTFSTSITVLSLAISTQLYAQTDSSTGTQVGSVDTAAEQKVSK